jgi:hypothetical protein
VIGLIIKTGALQGWPPLMLPLLLSYLTVGFLLAVVVSLYLWREIHASEKSRMFAVVWLGWAFLLAMVVVRAAKRIKSEYFERGGK